MQHGRRETQIQEKYRYVFPTCIHIGQYWLIPRKVFGFNCRKSRLHKIQTETTDCLTAIFDIVGQLQ